MPTHDLPSAPATADLAIVVCGVLEWNVKRIAERHPERQLHVRELPAQLHSNPRKLRTYLQTAIDELAEQPDLGAICLGFGVCGRGTIGLESRNLPLIIPRAQDCIGICLGSHARHMEQFAASPGTRYLTEGWYRKTIAEPAIESHMTAADQSLYGVDFEELAFRFGQENARFICEFRESWKRNYSRAAYIAFPGEPSQPPGQKVTSGMADALGWQHDVVAGDESLLEAMLTGHWHDPRLLVVPPWSRTVSAPGHEVIGYCSAFQSQAVTALERFASTANRQVVPIVRQGLGLGIDTGGTYTDAVIYDFAAGHILAKAKAPTRHHDLPRSIVDVLDALPADHLRQVRRVGLSTTLATNASVEGKGRPVALLLMSPFAIDPAELPFRFVHPLRGALSIQGEEIAPIDLEQVRQTAVEAQRQGCQAFAVSGFASVVNPVHELAVAHAAFAATGLPIVCGHELTSHLNFLERATTAAMNAKLIPLIEKLLLAVRDALRERGLGDVRVMVVKGDGSQMLDRVALELPVETLLSGPAASVIGAARLANCRDGLIADIGGTTLDMARLRHGLPELAHSGARVGNFQTSVRGMAIRTSGLGGDSEIDLSQWPAVHLGPRRIVPFCRLGEFAPPMLESLPAWLQRPLTVTRGILDAVAASPDAAPTTTGLGELTPTPIWLLDLAEKLGRPSPAFIDWEKHETAGQLVRYGLTLTDILHCQGTFTEFDRPAATALLQAWATLLDTDPENLVDAIHREFRRRVVDATLGLALPESCPWDASPDLRHWLTAHLAEPADHADHTPRLNASLGLPLVAVGAPAEALFPQLRPILGQVVVAPHAEVANAFGAIVGEIALQETATIRVTETGGLVCSWRGGSQTATSLEKALAICENALLDRLRQAAAANDIPYSQPFIQAVAQEAKARDGIVFLGVNLAAELRG